MRTGCRLQVIGESNLTPDSDMRVLQGSYGGGSVPVSMGTSLDNWAGSIAAYKAHLILRQATRAHAGSASIRPSLCQHTRRALTKRHALSGQRAL
jgi:hypothetical protein